MRLELNSDGKFVLHGVSAEAWELIVSERERVGSPEHFCFGRESFDGTVYVTVTQYEDKTEIVSILNKFVLRYDMTTDEAGEKMLNAWREEAEQTYKIMRSNAEREAAERLAMRLKQIMRDGCRTCSYFRSERCGDDLNGYCTAMGKTALQESPLSFQNGKMVNGVHYMGTKFYPCDSCLFLRYKEEVA